MVKRYEERVDVERSAVSDVPFGSGGICRASLRGVRVTLWVMGVREVRKGNDKSWAKDELGDT